MQRTLLLGAVLLASTTAAYEQASAQTRPQYPIQRDGAAPEGPAAEAPIPWDRRRLERLERNVNKLENAIARMRPDRPVPNLVETDPEVVTLQAQTEDLAGRIGDLETALQRLNGALETSTFELDKARRDQAAAQAQAGALATRVAELETRLAAAEQAAQAAQAAGVGAPTAEAAPAVESTGSSAADFQAAMKIMLDGEYAGAERAFQSFLTRWPASAEAPEAHYRLGETLYLREEYAAAGSSYVKALKGWPKSKWAPDAVVKLGITLSNLGKAKEACAAAAEFDRRYAATASASVKGRAASLKTKAKCAA